MPARRVEFFFKKCTPKQGGVVIPTRRPIVDIDKSVRIPTLKIYEGKIWSLDKRVGKATGSENGGVWTKTLSHLKRRENVEFGPKMA